MAVAALAGLQTAGGRGLSLLHLVALQLVAGVGLDYALFFARPRLDAEERARTVRTLVTCNGMTLLTFGLLAACQTPLLRDIGVTVAVGAVLAMAFAFLLAGLPGRVRLRDAAGADGLHGGQRAGRGGGGAPGGAAGRAVRAAAQRLRPGVGGWIGRVPGVEAHAAAARRRRRSTAATTGWRTWPCGRTGSRRRWRRRGRDTGRAGSRWCWAPAPAG